MTLSPRQRVLLNAGVLLAAAAALWALTRLPVPRWVEPIAIIVNVLAAISLVRENIRTGQYRIGRRRRN